MMDVDALYRKYGIQDDDLVYHEAGHAVAASVVGFPVQ
jgi:hypothetical protein